MLRNQALFTNFITTPLPPMIRVRQGSDSGQYYPYPDLNNDGDPDTDSTMISRIAQCKRNFSSLCQKLLKLLHQS